MYLHCIILLFFADFVEWNGRMEVERITPRFRCRFRWCDSQTVTCHITRTYCKMHYPANCCFTCKINLNVSPWCGEREVSRGRHREWHSDRISSEPGSGDNAETPTTVTMWTMGHLQPHLHCARVIVLGIGTCCCLLCCLLVEFPSELWSVFRLSRLATLSRSSKAVILLCPLIILIG